MTVITAFTSDTDQDARLPIEGNVARILIDNHRKFLAFLEPQYREALERIEVQGISVKGFAAEQGISASNVAVRVFRARDALRKQVTASCGTCAEHGCIECTCESKSSHGCGVKD